MASTKLAPSPRPLGPRSPSQQNIQPKSPFNRPLPLRKPSLKEVVPSPRKHKADEVASSASADSPASKRRRIEPRKDAEVPDMAVQMNKAVANKYQRGDKLGEGTYANVYRGNLTADPSNLVAIKRFKVIKDYKGGINVDTIREIKFMQELRHENIVLLYDVFAEVDNTLNAVIEFADGGTLEDLIHDKANVHYGQADTKAWMGMLLRAVYFCHRNFVLHRDIKPGNLLLAADGTLKLADFGLARSFSEPRDRMTHEVITLWYRPPELLFGSTHYGGCVDIWSCGMVFAEMMLRFPFAAPDLTAEEINKSGSHLAELDVIQERLGTITEESWPGVTSLPNFVRFEKNIPPADRRKLRGMMRDADDASLTFLLKLLMYDPQKRLSAKQSLEDEYWSVEPRPTKISALPRKKNPNSEKMGEAMANPGKVEPDVAKRFKGVAKKLDFGAAK